jgi:signal transduction histidine kinase
MLDLLEETGRLIYIVESLLILSQADAGKFTIELRPLEFTAFLDELIEDVEILATPRGITLSTEFEPGVQVNANVQFLRQVLLNLFDNAVKYNLPNGEIRARLVSSNGQAVFTICNTGANISSEDRTRIFDRFHRADRSRERATGGQGLGLSICREIIRAHGGEISLEPSDHGWTCFRFSLPLCEAPAPGV